MVELLFLIGLGYAITQAWQASTTAVGTARKNARTRATARGGQHNTSAHARRAARQATTGWWLGETRHGFPVTRAGFTQGLAAHRRVMREHHRDAAQRDADHEVEWAKWRAEIASHWQRMRVAAAHQPNMSDQLRAGLDAHARQAEARLHKATEDYRNRKDPAPKPPPAPNGRAGTTTGGNAVGNGADINYDQTRQHCGDLITAAEHAVNDADLTLAQVLADHIGASLRNDAETTGKAAEVVQAITDMQTSAKRLQEAAEALDYRVETTYGPMQEAVDAASGADAPEPEYLDH